LSETSNFYLAPGKNKRQGNQLKRMKGFVSINLNLKTVMAQETFNQQSNTKELIHPIELFWHHQKLLVTLFNRLEPGDDGLVESYFDTFLILEFLYNEFSCSSFCCYCCDSSSSF
jgi:hypothetical protein